MMVASSDTTRALAPPTMFIHRPDKRSIGEARQELDEVWPHPDRADAGYSRLAYRGPRANRQADYLADQTLARLAREFSARTVTVAPKTVRRSLGRPRTVRGLG